MWCFLQSRIKNCKYVSLNEVMITKTAFAITALPGGLIQDDETLDECAKRELEEETGIKAGSIKQFMNFSAPKETLGKGQYQSHI